MDTNIINGKSILTNSGDAYSGTLSVGDTAYVDGGIYLCKVSSVNTTTTPTLNLNSIGAKTIYNISGLAITIGDLRINTWAQFLYDQATDKFIFLNGPSPINIAKTVFVSKNGNDDPSLGLVERFDRPFLTLAAARAAALTLIPSATNRVLIKVFSGRYLEGIILANYVDWDLSDAIIERTTGDLATIDDNNVACNSVVYGKAELNRSGSFQPNGFVVKTQNALTNLVLYCKSITNSIALGKSGVLINGGTQFISCVSIVGNIAGQGVEGGADGTLTVYCDTIFGPDGGVTNGASTCIMTITAREISASDNYAVQAGISSGALTINNARCITTDTNQSAVGIASDTLILNNVILLATGTGYGIVNTLGTHSVRIYGQCISNNSMGPSITQLVGSITVSSNVI